MQSGWHATHQAWKCLPLVQKTCQVAFNHVLLGLLDSVLSARAVRCVWIAWTVQDAGDGTTGKKVHEALCICLEDAIGAHTMHTGARMSSNDLGVSCIVDMEILVSCFDRMPYLVSFPQLDAVNAPHGCCLKQVLGIHMTSSLIAVGCSRSSGLGCLAHSGTIDWA